VNRLSHSGNLAKLEPHKLENLFFESDEKRSDAVKEMRSRSGAEIE